MTGPLLSRPLRAGLILLAQLALVLAVYGRFAWERAHLPRRWVHVAPVDPVDPFRGRYLLLRTPEKQDLPLYLPEHAVDPTRGPDQQNLWLEVSVPPSGLPRALRLGVRRGETFVPLDLR